MRAMPDIPRTESPNHEASVAALQKWLWVWIEVGWDPMSASGGRWSHEDNLIATQLGWMISQPPDSKYLDLFSLKKGVTPAQIMRQIVAMAPICPLCAQAVAILSAQKLKYPNQKFAFDEP